MRTEIENRYRDDLEALNRVWSMAHKGAAPPQKKANPVHHKDATGQVLEVVAGALEIAGSYNKRAAVRAAIQSFSGAFGSKDVRAALLNANPALSAVITDNQLSSIIARLAELNEIHAVVSKTGRTPAVYCAGPKPLEVQAS